MLRTTRTISMTAAAATALLLASGCARDHLNDRNVLGGATTFAFLDPNTSSVGDGTTLPPSDPPSTTGVDRAAWAPTTVHVPVDGVVHAPTYASARRPVKDDQARRIGLVPTPESALDLNSDQPRRAGEIAVEPFRALGDLALMPVRAVFRPPWSWTQSPVLVMKRTPATDVEITGSVHDAPPASTPPAPVEAPPSGHADG